MNTFLISNKFSETAKVLDNKRLNKQITEGLQLIYVYMRKQNIIKDGKRGWQNHPVTKIWTDKNGKIYIYQLIEYIDAMYYEWIKRGYKHKWINDQFVILGNLDKKLFGDKYKKLNWSDLFFETMKRNLIRKDAYHYTKYFGALTPAEGYIWENCIIK